MNEAPGQILIVGATEAFCADLAAEVARQGGSATVATDPAQALATLRANPPALVLLVFDFPDGGGLKLVEGLKADATLAEVPVVAVAPMEQFRAVQQSLALGVEDYVYYPFQPQVIKARLDAVRVKQMVLAQAEEARHDELLLKIERDVQIGRRIQKSFLPAVLPEIPNWELAAQFEPAREVAGDFYDAFPLNQNRRLGIVIGDVCDKGVGAALFMALFRSLTRAYAQQHYSMSSFMGESTDFLSGPVADRRRSVPSAGITALKSAMNLTNNYIIENHGDSNMFATMFFGVLDPVTGVMAYINGGHNAPWLFNSSGIKMRLTATGPAVGMLPDVDYGIQQITIEPGDILFTFTDGVPEARDPAGGFFTEARLRTLITDPPPSTARDLLSRIYVELMAHIATAAQFDDITMLAVRRLPASQPPVIG
jgi:sigma-B regulation protein RsbU (phosphoserine phosphatase)